MVLSLTPPHISAVSELVVDLFPFPGAQVEVPSLQSML